MPFCFNIRCNIKDVLFCTKPAGRGLSCFRGDEKIMASTLKGIQLAVCDYNSICIFIFWFLYVFSDIGWIDPIGLEGFVYILIELRIKYILKIFFYSSIHSQSKLSLLGHKQIQLFTETIKNQNNTVHRWGDVPGSQLWTDQCHHIFFTCAEARKKSCSICQFKYFPKY